MNGRLQAKEKALDVDFSLGSTFQGEAQTREETRQQILNPNLSHHIGCKGPYVLGWDPSCVSRFSNRKTSDFYNSW